MDSTKYQERLQLMLYAGLAAMVIMAGRVDPTAIAMRIICIAGAAYVMMKLGWISPMQRSI